MVAINIGLVNIITTIIILNLSYILCLGLSEKGDFICFKNKINSAELATENKSSTTMDLPTPQQRGSSV